MGLNQTNWRAITKVWGVDSDDWLDKQVELSAGTVPYDGKEVETILLKPVSPVMSASERALAKPPKPDDRRTTSLLTEGARALRGRASRGSLAPQ